MTLAVDADRVKRYVRFVPTTSYRLYRVNPEVASEAEVIEYTDRERQMARAVFKRWPVAACLPYKAKDGDDAGAFVLAIWETAEDAKAKRPPIALVRTVPKNGAGFKQQLWVTPVSA